MIRRLLRALWGMLWEAAVLAFFCGVSLLAGWLAFFLYCLVINYPDGVYVRLIWRPW